jgi:uncharacterized protein (UPF0212 family)
MDEVRLLILFIGFAVEDVEIDILMTPNQACDVVTKGVILSISDGMNKVTLSIKPFSADRLKHAQ